MGREMASAEHRRESDQRQLLELIQTYIHAIDVAVNMILTRALATANPFRAWCDGQVGTKGKLGPFKGTFHFRGHGCVIVFASHRIEFDFGPKGRHDGFTAYYLRRHVELNKLLRRQFRDLEISEGMNRLEQEGLIFQPEWEPTPHLFYLTAPGIERLQFFEASNA